MKLTSFIELPECLLLMLLIANYYKKMADSSKFDFNTPLKLLAVSALMACVACTPSRVKELPEDPQLGLPKQFETVDLEAISPSQTPADSTEVEEVIEKPKSAANGWVQAFEDSGLTEHIQTALQNNPDLWSSAAQLKNAIEQVTITGSSLWPSLRISGSASHSESGIANDSNVVSGGEAVTPEIRSIGGTLDISWEADVWGKLSQRKKAAALGAQAQTEIYKAAELSLVANVSRAWFNVITNKLQLDLAQRRLDSFNSTANLIEENYERGLRSALDVYRSRTDVQLQRSSLADSKFNYLQSLRAFKTLLGRYPDTSLAFNAKLPEITDSVSTGLPAELLVRRPDIKASQLRYQASIANAKAAYRDRFPSINFTGTIGESRDTINSVFDRDNMIERFILNLTAPVFAAGALRSLEDQAYNDAEAAYANLVKTSLTAFEEVENTLSREELLKQQYKANKAAVKLAQDGLSLAIDRYQSGIENYNTVLDSQRSLFNSMSNEINIRNALLQNRIGIYLALGGDFSNSEAKMNTKTLPGPSQTQNSAVSNSNSQALELENK